jgi:hypothetical protein
MSDSFADLSILANVCAKHAEQTDGLFRIKKITNHRNGGMECRVVWYGFSKKYNSWEPAESLAHTDLYRRYSTLHGLKLVTPST